MTHEELKQKVFSLAKNLEGIYDIRVNTKTQIEFPLWKEKVFYSIELKFEPWVRDDIKLMSQDIEELLKDLEFFLSSPITEVVQQLINAKVF